MANKKGKRQTDYQREYRKAYRLRFPDKYKKEIEDGAFRKTGKTKEQREENKRRKWVNITMPELVKDAIDDIRKRILKENKEFVCTQCSLVLPLSQKAYTFGMCKKCYKEKSKTWKCSDRKSMNEYQRVWKKNKMDSDPCFKLGRSIRVRIGEAIKSCCKIGRKQYRGKIKYLGCTAEELKAFLELKFDKRMTWKNHGKYWHIDHIRPVSSFDLNDENERLKAFNYQNLQPLEKSKNLSKGARWWPEHTQLGLLL